MPTSIKGYYFIKDFWSTMSQDPQLWDKTIEFQAILVDCLIIFFTISIQASLFLQISSMVRLLRFLTPNRDIRILIGILMIFPLLLYIHDVTMMLSYNWGMPAYKMTQLSKMNGMYVNSYDSCFINNLDIDNSMH